MTATKNTGDRPNKFYIISVTALTFVLPAIGFIAEYLANDIALTFELFCKWFIFSAVGLRLFLAGIKQVKNPEFTAKQIFHVENADIFTILRELGFANICFGLVGIVSLFRPDWRIVSAFASGLYYGIAGIQHGLKKNSGINEKFALWTDLLISAFLLAYFIKAI
ncbi:hypothetical protein DC498_19325 [Terrimonas sp.]|uniref:DUF6790 family protein n=1 Tax=Terrimonas sp. TaxID=1914338 RepID=UPI000D50B1D7|nr:DUF6790 family protein [Terrimonas sp.]PVD50579.1 hypothetical protein DC498_19325 [Terrimonas sp.]